MTNEQILTLVRAYGTACVVDARACEAVLSAPRGDVDSAHRAAAAYQERIDALRAVESALASLTKDR